MQTFYIKNSIFHKKIDFLQKFQFYTKNSIFHKFSLNRKNGKIFWLIFDIKKEQKKNRKKLKKNRKKLKKNRKKYCKKFGQ